MVDEFELTDDENEIEPDNDLEDDELDDPSLEDGSDEGDENAGMDRIDDEIEFEQVDV